MTNPDDIFLYEVIVDQSPAHQVNIGVKDDYLSNMSEKMLKLLKRELEFSKVANDLTWIIIKKPSGGWQVDELDIWMTENAISNVVVSTYGCAFQNKEDAEIFALRWL